MLDQSQSGFSLISVLFAWLVCTCCALAAYRAARSALQHVTTAHYHSVAVVLLSNASLTILGRVKQAWWQQWRQDVANLLPQGQSSVRCESQRCRVSVRWFYQHQCQLSDVYRLP